jgi:hypothetical protein
MLMTQMVPGLPDIVQADNLAQPASSELLWIEIADQMGKQPSGNRGEGLWPA